MVDAWLSFAASAESHALAAWLRSSPWGYPAVETLHILGLATLTGSAVAFDLRLLGVASLLPIEHVARLLLPLARVGFGVAVLSGIVLFMMQARTFAVMPLFFIKMGAIAIAVTNTMVFHRGVFVSAHAWPEGPTPAGARFAAGVSLVCWAFAITCGRFLAYV